jgi:homoaconitase/3-isopropylmalate dehydratase large subunit
VAVPNQTGLIGTCQRRLEDLRSAAGILKDTMLQGMQLLVTPASRKYAGIAGRADEIFIQAAQLCLRHPADLAWVPDKVFC